MQKLKNIRLKGLFDLDMAMKAPVAKCICEEWVFAVFGMRIYQETRDIKGFESEANIKMDIS